MTEPTIKLVAGAETIVVRGRTAVLIGLLVQSAERVNALPVGKLVVAFAHQQVKLELRESLPSTPLP
jgi:hypothetical protein